ncbi:MAG: helix-turn-helix domain-containing protein, partial [Casimicrobiaceae bacterium]
MRQKQAVLATALKVRTRSPAAPHLRILRAATRAFADRGLTVARVAGIAARAKVNKRMLYHYYGNKEALYLAVLE